MKDDNWTDYKRPCFCEYRGEIDGERPDDCDLARLEDDCIHIADGGAWETCTDGALSSHCPNSIKPKESTNA